MNGLFEDRHSSVMKILDRKAEKEDTQRFEDKLMREIKDLQKILAMYPEPSELELRLEYIELEVNYNINKIFRSKN